MSRSVQKTSKLAEQRVAEKVGGVRQPASGAFWSRKGDIKQDRSSVPVKDLLIEHKMTEKKSISLKGDWLEKIFNEALLDGRQPVVAIELLGQVWYMTPEEDFLAMREEIVRQHGQCE